MPVGVDNTQETWQVLKNTDYRVWIKLGQKKNYFIEKIYRQINCQQNVIDIPLPLEGLTVY